MTARTEAFHLKVEDRTYFQNIYRKVFKRFLDIFFVLSTAPFAVPLILAIAVIVAAGGGSPFYWQRRVGRGERVFNLLKIRTMVPNSEEILLEYLAACPVAREEWEATQKLKNDIRITPFGRFLRKSSLDELPQLWNVLKGEMSLVGPRPMLVDQMRLYPGTAYFALRPGITGPWQISARNSSSFASRATFDTDYYKTLSLRRDLSILVRTIDVVFRCTGY